MKKTKKVFVVFTKLKVLNVQATNLQIKTGYWWRFSTKHSEYVIFLKVKRVEKYIQVPKLQIKTD
jgi:hypothetical protein